MYLCCSSKKNEIFVDSLGSYKVVKLNSFSNKLNNLILDLVRVGRKVLGVFRTEFSFSQSSTSCNYKWAEVRKSWVRFFREFLRAFIAQTVSLINRVPSFIIYDHYFMIKRKWKGEGCDNFLP